MIELGAVTNRDRVPWGIAQIWRILALTATGWVVIFVVVRLALGGALRAHPIDVTMLVAAALYAMLYLAIVLVIRRVAGWRALGYHFPGWPSLLGILSWLPAWYALLFGVGLGAAYVLNHGHAIPTNTTEIFGPGGINAVGPLELALILVVVAGVAPLVEETFFRGVLYQWLRGRLSILPAVVLSSLLFAAAHVLPLLLPVLFVMGCMLAAAFQRTRSLYASMLLHGTNNAVAVLAVVLGLGR